MIPPEAIEEKLTDIILAKATLNDILAVYSGDPYRVPSQFYPYISLAVTDETEGQEFLGAVRRERIYSGMLFLELRQQSKPKVVARRASVTGHREVQRLVNALVYALWEYPDLDGLTYTGPPSGKVTELEVGANQIVYGNAPDQERPDTLNYFGIVPFRVV